MLAFWVGFLSMSEEILWIRLVSFHKLGVPQAFAFVLALFLVGVALGAAWGRHYCAQDAETTLRNGLWLVAAGGLATMGLPSLIKSLEYPEMPAVLDLLFLFAIPLSAAIKAALFPIVHHLGSKIEPRATGHSVARVYFFNIAGSTMGPLLTGFVLLDYLTTGALFFLLGVLAMLLAGSIALINTLRLAIPTLIVASIGMGVIDANDHSLIISIADKAPRSNIHKVIENRHGIVHVVTDERAGDVIFGGNVYDGRTNIDLVANTNGISRAYLLAALHTEPKRILVIGLSSGAWTRVISSFPSAEQIEVVEINPAYVQLMRDYPHISPLISDPRIKIHIDDGRRWLKRNPHEKFDLVVMNTTFHWRAHATNLLSREFLQLARSRLAPGGVMAFNATGSPDAFFTAAQVFPHAYRWGNFIYAAEHDLTNIVVEDAERRYYSLRWSSGEHVLDQNSLEVRNAVNRLLNPRFIAVSKEKEIAGRELQLITDANMITEFRHAKSNR